MPMHTSVYECYRVALLAMASEVTCGRTRAAYAPQACDPPPAPLATDDAGVPGGARGELTAAADDGRDARWMISVNWPVPPQSPQCKSSSGI